MFRAPLPVSRTRRFPSLWSDLHARIVERSRPCTSVLRPCVLRGEPPGPFGGSWIGSLRLTAGLSGHVAIHHRSSIAEVVLEILPGRAPGQIANEAPASNLRQVASWSSLGVLVRGHGESRPFHRSDEQIEPVRPTHAVVESSARAFVSPRVLGRRFPDASGGRSPPFPRRSVRPSFPPLLQRLGRVPTSNERRKATSQSRVFARTHRLHVVAMSDGS